jgi:hypothetical protein
MSAASPVKGDARDARAREWEGWDGGGVERATS